MKTIPITLNIGGLTKALKKDAREFLGHNKVYSGLTTGKLFLNSDKKEFTVWINSRQSEREFVDTFYHEMTHLLCKLMGFKTKNEEALAQWVGYLAKGQFADQNPSRFGRVIEKVKKRRRKDE